MKRIEFLQRVLPIAGFGSFNLKTLLQKRKIYLHQFFVAGFRHYKGMELLPHMQVNDLLELRREPANPYDDSAVALYWQQEKIGFIPSDSNSMLAKLLDAQAIPLLGMITHLNRDVKPWENVVAAIYFLQDEKITLSPHTKYLQETCDPIYKTAKKVEKENLLDQIFEYDNRLVDLDTIDIKTIKDYFTAYAKEDKKRLVSFKGKKYVNVSTDDIYFYMYNVNPIKWVKADDGERYILFEFVEFPQLG